MKQFIAPALFSSTLMFLFTPAFALVPPPTHSLISCVKIVNLDQFPDIALIARVRDQSGFDMYYPRDFATYQIKKDTCLEMTPPYTSRYNRLSIYWNTKEKPDCLESNKLILSDIELPPKFVDEDDPLVAVDIEYSLARSSDERFILYKSKQVSEYNDSTPQKVETFPSPLEEKEIKGQKNQLSKNTITRVPAEHVIRPVNVSSSHSCVTIANLDKFPDIALIAYYEMWTKSNRTIIKEFETYPIVKDVCLKGNGYLVIRIYWNTKDKRHCIESNKLVPLIPSSLDPSEEAAFFSALGLEHPAAVSGLGVENPREKNKSLLLPEVYLEINKRLASIDIEYSLAKSFDGKLFLYKSKQISRYKDDTPSKVETFSNPGRFWPSMMRSFKGFWKSITYSFKRLFGIPMRFER